MGNLMSTIDAQSYNYNRIFIELIKVPAYSIILFLLIFFDNIILPTIIPWQNPGTAFTGLSILIILIEASSHLLYSVTLKRSLSFYPVKFNKLYNELKIITIFIIIIPITFIILGILPFIIHELNSINYGLPLFNTIGWFSLIESITLSVLLPFFYYKKKNILLL